MSRKLLAALTAVLATLAMMASVAGAATTTVRVDANGAGGWVFNGDPANQTPYEFSLDHASIGYGSLHVLPITNTINGNGDKFTAALPLGTPVSDFTSFSIDFWVQNTGTNPDPAQQFYLNVYTNLPASGTYYDCRFDYVATTGSTSAWTTLTAASTSAPTDVASRGGATCPSTLAGMPAGSTISLVVVNVGDTSGNDTGVGGYLDNGVLVNASNTTIYDFEVPLQVKEDCKNGGYVMFGFANQGQCVSSLQANAHAGK